MSGAPAPTWVTEAELSARLRDLPDPGVHTRARVLVRLHGAPLGQVLVPVEDGAVRAGRLAAAVERDLAGALAAHLEADGLRRAAGGPVPPEPAGGCRAWAPDGPWPAVSVVVCTRDRVQSLGRTLDSLAALARPPLEVVVVDNAPPDDGTARLVARRADPRVRRVEEPLPGLSRARNRGVAEARGDIVAFTDDDVRVDARWLEGLVRGFNRTPRVGCVTGLVPGAELETPAQALFEGKVSWGAHLAPRLFDVADPPPGEPLFPFTTGAVGAGASFAARRDLVRALGGFDEALGAGTPSRGGEDIDFFFRVLRARWCIAYEPTAIAWHFHRRDRAAAERQLFGYGSGLTAYAAKVLVSGGVRWSDLRRVPRAARRLGGVVEGPAEVRATRAERMAELRGMAAGPVLYAQGAYRARRHAPRARWITRPGS